MSHRAPRQSVVFNEVNTATHLAVADARVRVISFEGRQLAAIIRLGVGEAVSHTIVEQIREAVRSTQFDVLESAQARSPHLRGRRRT